MNENKEQRQYKILVIEDLPTENKLMVEVLEEERYGYMHFHCENSQEVCRIVTEENPDLIILDCNTLAMSMIDTIKQLKSTETTASTPILIATGILSSAEHMCIALEAGAIDFIRKPYDKVELIARIHTALHLGDSFKEIKRRQKEMEQLTEALFLLNETIEEKNQELYQSVITDSLTQIYNRAFLLETLSKEFSRNKRHNQPLSCIMIDIDFFKSFNDLYGHKVGDFILVQITSTIRKIVRNEDIFGRLGGEEFLLILPGCGEGDSQVVAEKVRLHIENTPYVHNDITLTPRISLGVADNVIGFPHKADDMIHHADLALYEAKRTGRNKTILFSSIMNATESGNGTGKN